VVAASLFAERAETRTKAFEQAKIQAGIA